MKSLKYLSALLGLVFFYELIRWLWGFMSFDDGRYISWKVALLAGAAWAAISVVRREVNERQKALEQRLADQDQKIKNLEAVVKRLKERTNG